MVEIITKSRGQNLNSPVLIPLYKGMMSNLAFDDVDKQPVVNVAKAKNDANGIRSKLDLGVTYTDIEGLKVGMIATDGTNTFRDIVTLIGATNTGIVVRFDDEPEQNYTVRRSSVKFVSNTE